MRIESPTRAVTVERLAERFEVHRTVCQKWLAQNGFEFCRVRLKERRNQLCSAILKADAQKAIILRKSQGYLVRSPEGVKV